MGIRPTIYDVAAAAGVAPSTVSRTFSRPGRVNAATAARIREVAAALGYRNQPIGSGAGPGRTGTVALFVSDVTNPFYFEIIRGATEAAAVGGFLLVLADTTESPVLEREYLERTLALVDGLVLASSRMSDQSIRMMAKQRPTVVLNRVLPDVLSVVTDSPRGVRRAVEHLTELGHDTITYVAGPAESWADGTRWRSLLEAAHELDLRVHRIGPYPPTVRAGLQAARDLDLAATRAVLAYNDLIGVGVVRGLQQLGALIPDDVSVIGFDNILLDEILQPGLTTVAAPLRSLGAIGVQNVIAAVNGAQPAYAPVTLPAKLVVRGSTGPCFRHRHVTDQRSRNSTSPASGTTKVSGSAANTDTSTPAGSR